MAPQFAPNGVRNIVVRDEAAFDAFPGRLLLRPITPPEVGPTSVAAVPTPTVTEFEEARDQQEQSPGAIERRAARQYSRRRSSCLHTDDGLVPPSATPRSARNFLLEYETINPNIAMGGQGAVSIIKSNRDGMTCVLKEARWEEKRRDRENHKEALHREVDMLLSCRESPHIVDVTDIFISPTLGRVQRMIMEYADGGDLLDYRGKLIARGRQVPEVYAWHFVKQMAGALKYIHDDLGAEAIIHRDIKPANWLIFLPSAAEPRGLPTIKLTDFGIARHQVDMHHALGEYTLDNFVGSLYWQPEEPNRETTAADVWAMGACVYWFVSGLYPVSECPEDWWLYPEENGFANSKQAETYWALTAARVTRGVNGQGVKQALAKELGVPEKAVKAYSKQLAQLLDLMLCPVEERKPARQIAEDANTLTQELARSRCGLSKS